MDDGDLVNLRTLSFVADRYAGNVEVESSDDDDDHSDKLPDWGIRAGPRQKIWFDPSKVYGLVFVCVFQRVVSATLLS